MKFQDPEVLFLMETKLDVRNMEWIQVEIGYPNVFTIPCHGKSCGVVLLWKQEIQIVIRKYSFHHIDSHVCIEDEKEW